MSNEYRVENLIVYGKLCDFHIEVCDISLQWPTHERNELGTQIRRSSSCSPANLAERHNDRHIRNLNIAARKKYVERVDFEQKRDRYEECVCMLIGLERNYEQKLDKSQRKWPMNADEREQR